MTLTAGQHPVPLDQVHADMGPDQLRQHLAFVHGRHVPAYRGAAAAQRAHRRAHGETALEVLK